MKPITQNCRICKKPKIRSFFAPSEWERYEKTGAHGSCRECLRPKVRTGGGRAVWRKGNNALFVQ